VIEALLVILVLLEIIRLWLTIRANRKIDQNASDTEIMRDRWNEMCKGVTEIIEEAEEASGE